MLIDKLKKLGIVFKNDIPLGSTYLFPNGEFADLNATLKNGVFKRGEFFPPRHGNIRPATHPMLENFIYREGLCRSGVGHVLEHTDNAIRLQDAETVIERYYICLPPLEPTPIQYERLEDWLYHLGDRNMIDISNFNNDYYQVYDFCKDDSGTGYMPKDIINEIKKLYRRWHY